MTEAAINILIADSAFQTAIGRNKSNTRYKVYPVVAEQDEEPPYCVVFLSSQSPSSRCSDTGTIEVVVCAKPTTTGAYAKIKDLSEKARTALENHSGTESVSGKSIGFIFSNARDGYDQNAGVMQRITTYNVI